MKVFPVFLPFAGCVHRCVYCDQLVTTSVKGFGREGTSLAIATIHSFARRVMMGEEHPSEIAFYGGTFTLLPVEAMHTLLDCAARYIEEKVFSGIRFSTRPDAIGEHIIDVLGGYPISTVELGVQSIDDKVLRLSKRNYRPEVVKDSVMMVKSKGWKLGIQLMPGLPGDTHKIFKASVKSICDMQPHFVRLYPTVVLRNTILEKWYHHGLYVPLTLKEALNWCVEAFDCFNSKGIPVIRMGLPATEELNRGAVVAGPYHPAFGYLVRVHMWRRRIDSLLSTAERTCRSLIISLPRRFLSECVGPRRINILYWKKHWSFSDIVVKPLENEAAECPHNVGFYSSSCGTTCRIDYG